jgi:hypothetical protein
MASIPEQYIQAIGNFYKHFPFSGLLLASDGPMYRFLLCWGYLSVERVVKNGLGWLNYSDWLPESSVRAVWI